MDVVEIDDAVGWYAVHSGRQVELGHESAARSGDRRDNNGADSSSNRITGEHENRTGAAGGRSEPELTALHLSNRTSPRLDPNRRLLRATVRLHQAAVLPR